MRHCIIPTRPFASELIPRLALPPDGTSISLRGMIINAHVENAARDVTTRSVSLDSASDPTTRHRPWRRAITDLRRRRAAAAMAGTSPVDSRQWKLLDFCGLRLVGNTDALLKDLRPPDDVSTRAQHRGRCRRPRAFCAQVFRWWSGRSTMAAAARRRPVQREGGGLAAAAGTCTGGGGGGPHGAASCCHPDAAAGRPAVGAGSVPP